MVITFRKPKRLDLAIIVLYLYIHYGSSLLDDFNVRLEI